MLKLSKAIYFATLAHETQLRKTGGPYIDHPMRVMFLVSHFCMDEHTLCAAILHDVIEDTKYDFTDINMRFGYEVASLVDELTNKDPPASRKERMQLRNEKYAKLSTKAKIIKACDRIDNLRDIDKFEEDFQKIYLKESKDMVKYLKSTSKSSGEELRPIEELENLIISLENKNE
jgi:(p)ppGpp synthase/HD superfamily hydrolase